MVVISNDVYDILIWFAASNTVHFLAPIYKWHSSTRQAFQLCMAVNYIAITIVASVIVIGGIYATAIVAGAFTVMAIYINFH